MAIFYGGTLIPFGKHTRQGKVRVVKDIAFPAVDGVEVMHMGTRKKNFAVTGLMIDTVGGVFKESTIEGFNDTGVRSLSIHGEVFSNVRYRTHVVDRPFKSAVTDKIVATFTIQFEQLK